MSIPFQIIEVSSESDLYPGSNLLFDDFMKKWQTKSPSSEAHVILEFDKSYTISSIEIGNNHCAFIEISVCNDGDYQIILPKTSLMSKSEVKFGINKTKKFIFTNELIKDIRTQKWKKIKFECFQPFDDVEIGLSNIKILSDDIKPVEVKPSLEVPLMDSDEEEEEEEDAKLILERKRKRDKIEEEERRKRLPETLKKFINKGEEEEEEEEPKKKKRKTTKKKKKYKFKPLSSDEEEEKEESSNITIVKSRKDRKKKSIKRKKDIASSTDESDDESTLNVPYNEILKNVTFAISGIQNPDRSTIRDLALSMGAKYEVNWSTKCTHLVAAILRAPKVIQAQNDGGIIVTKDWIIECDKQKKRVNEKLYTLGQPPNKRKAKDDAKRKIKRTRKPANDPFLTDSEEEFSPHTSDEEFIDDSGVNDPPSDEEYRPSLDQSMMSEDYDAGDDVEESPNVSPIKIAKISSPEIEVKKIEDDNDWIKQDVKRLSDFHKKASLKISLFDMIKNTFEKTIQYAEEGDVYAICDDWEYSTPIPKGIRRCFKLENEECIAELQRLNRIYCSLILEEDEVKSDKTEEMNEEEINEGIRNIESFIHKNKKNEIGPIEELPNFLNGIKVYINENVNEKTKRRCTRFIIAYDGQVVNKFDKSVTHAIVNEDEESLNFGSAIVVEPDWVIACHKRQRKVNEDPFRLQ